LCKPHAISITTSDIFSFVSLNSSFTIRHRFTPLITFSTTIRTLEIILFKNLSIPVSPSPRRVIRLFRDYRPPEHAEYHLTPQQAELLKLLVEGHHKKTAAREMGISVNTVSFHLKKIYEKLQVHSKTEAVAKAIFEHLI